MPGRLSLVVCVLLGSLACGPEAPEVPEGPTLHVLELPGPLSERTPPAWLGSQVPSLHGTLTRLKELRGSPNVRGLLVSIAPMSGAWAQVAELAAEMNRWREQKLPVHCHLQVADNAAYSLATRACDRITMTPAGAFAAGGVGITLLRFRSLLEQVGLGAEMFQVGRYKGAAEPFTRDDVSPELRENLDLMLDTLQVQFKGPASKARKLEPEQLDAALDQVPFAAPRAVELGLVDQLGFMDEAINHALGESDASIQHRIFDPDSRPDPGLMELLALFSGDGDKPPDVPHIGLLPLLGAIQAGEASGSGTAAVPFIKAAKTMAENTQTRAVVLRINSPGGSALASDQMWHAVRALASTKPVVVSLGDVAASGGYYIAAAGDTILASEGSLVGSIGVVGGKVNVEPLATRLGISATHLTRGAHAGWLSPMRGLQPSESNALKGMLQTTYNLFLERVAEGRGVKAESLENAAQGRIMLGAQALPLGLIDELGGLDRAIEIASERADLGDDPTLYVWPGTTSLPASLQALLQSRMGLGQSDLSVVSGDSSQKIRRLLGDLLQGTGYESWAGGQDPCVAALPFEVQLH